MNMNRFVGFRNYLAQIFQKSKCFDYSKITGTKLTNANTTFHPFNDKASFHSITYLNAPKASSILTGCSLSRGQSQLGQLSNYMFSSLYGFLTFFRGMASLKQLHRRGPHIRKLKIRRPLDGCPFMKGVVLKTVIKKPRKPNSANRKCVLVKLRNGKEMTAFVPGEGHNLQEHSIVLVEVHKLKDTPGVKLRVVRGKYDCAHVVKKTG